ncbi:Protein SRT-27, partial [Aphelenchoides avenae]
MDRFFFHRDEYDRLYNCSGRSLEEWKSYGHRSVPLGIVYITLGTLYEVLYIPFLIVMASPKFMKLSCFK